MRAFATILSLGLAASALAAPSSLRSPRLMAKDPMSLHRRSIALPDISFSAVLSTPARLANSLVDVLSHGAAQILRRPSLTDPLSSDSASSDAEVDHDRAEAYAYADEYYASYEDEVAEWEEKHSQCAEICRVRLIDGAGSGRQALCSSEGLESTLECAQCIDSTWPEEDYADSAMAEFDRIAKSCQVGSTS